MSHNSIYYAKKIRKIDSNKCRKLDGMGFFVNASPSPNSCEPGIVDMDAKVIDDDDNLKNSHSTISESDQCEAIAGIKPTELQSASVSKGEHDSNYKEHQLDSTDDSDSDHNVELPVPDQRIYSSGKYERSFPWLYFSSNPDRRGFFCKYCEVFEVAGTDVKFIHKGVFLKENPTRRLKKHSDSARHIKAQNKYAKANSMFPSKGEGSTGMMISVWKQLQDTDKKSQEKNRNVLKKLFRCAYYIVRRRWAETNFSSFVNFVATLGVQDLLDHIQNAPERVTYMSAYTVSEMINMMGDDIENQLLISLRAANFYTLLADESTDDANREQLSIFARWIYKEKSDDHFLGLINVEKTDSESLMSAIEQFLLAKNLDIKKCRFVGFDGANTMSGEVSGLQRRVRNKSPFVLYVNCRCHRLALCLKHLMKTFPLLVEVDAGLLAIWKLFHYSPRRFAVFNSVQEMYGDKPLTLIRAATTRWLSHGKACIRFVNRYPAILDALDALYDDRKEPEVFGLRMLLTRKDIIAMILLLCDVLKPVNILSMFLQSPDICFMDVDPRVKVTVNQLEALIPMFENTDESTYFARHVEMFAEIDDRTDLQRRMRYDHMNLSIEHFLRDTGIPFIHSLINEITDAFTAHPLLSSFSALDPRCLPDNVNDLTDHGKAQVDRLLQHYGNHREDTFRGNTVRCEPDIDSTITASGEYAAFKHQLFMLNQSTLQTVSVAPIVDIDNLRPLSMVNLNLLKQLTKGYNTPAEVLKAFQEDTVLSNCFSRIRKLVELMNIIPTSTASVERGFSLMNNLCTPLRSRLGQIKLDSLMRICAEGNDDLDSITLDRLLDTFKHKKDRKLGL